MSASAPSGHTLTVTLPRKLSLKLQSVPVGSSAFASAAQWALVTHVTCVESEVATSHRMTPLGKVVLKGTWIVTTEKLLLTLVTGKPKPVMVRTEPPASVPADGRTPVISAGVHKRRRELVGCEFEKQSRWMRFRARIQRHLLSSRHLQVSIRIITGERESASILGGPLQLCPAARVDNKTTDFSLRTDS